MDNISLPENKIPAHIGIILDGNGRWAKKRSMPRNAGHKAGADALGPVIRHCQRLGVKCVTLYVFSTENWRRPKEEVDGIMNLLRSNLKQAEKFRGENARIRILGDIEHLDDDLKTSIAEIEHKSAGNTGITVCFALNYGGRQEIISAVKKIASDVKENSLTIDEIDEEVFSSRLYTAGIVDPDLIIRPSGEKRISNFLLWQCAYSEFVFMDILWPDFTPDDLDMAIAEYSKRSRRFGGI